MDLGTHDFGAGDFYQVKGRSLRGERGGKGRGRKGRKRKLQRKRRISCRIMEGSPETSRTGIEEVKMGKEGARGGRGDWTEELQS